MTEDQNKSNIEYAETNEDVVILRVIGKGNFSLSPKLKQITDSLNADNGSKQYVFDIEKCITLDSTFMGVMASIAINQSKSCEVRAVVINTNEITARQIGVLGINYLLDLYGKPSNEQIMENVEFKSAPEAPQTRLDQILHMIESHQTLVDTNSENEIKFRTVLDSLAGSLEKEEGKY